MRHIIALGIVAALLLPAPARASRTLAVLPLEQAAGSEEHAGLGAALAGMLVSDLSRVEALQLVERSRLEELLGELELVSSGFLDPATAQQLGQGLGAELVVVGSYSVIKTQFLLDARIIEVESAAVLRAVDAQGTADDFVTVEKDLIEALLVGLEVELASGVRRKILADAPTESFPAFSAYGQGLDHQAAGRVEEAKHAFEDAVGADPEFVAAREALSALRTRVEEERALAADAAQGAEDVLFKKVLAAFPDERDLPAAYEHDTASLAGLSLRWLVLREQGRHCQCYDEMTHYLDRVEWQVQQPVPSGRDDDLFVTTMRAAIDVGLIEHPGSLRTIPFDRPDVSSYPSLWTDTAWFVLDLTGGDPSTTVGQGLIVTMKHCHGPAEQVAELEQIQARVAHHGVGGQESQIGHAPGVTVEHHLESQWCYLRAKHFGVDDEVQRRMEALVDALDGEEARAWAVQRTDRVVQVGDLWDRWTNARRRLPDGVLVEVTQAVVDEQGGPIRWDDPYCAKAAEFEEYGAKNAWKNYQEDRDREDTRRLESTMVQMGGVASELLDLGCIDGYPGVARDVYEVYAFVGTAADRKRDDHAEDEACVRAFEAIPAYVDPAKLDPVAGQEDTLTTYAVQALGWYYSSLLLNRCVEDVRR